MNDHGFSEKAHSASFRDPNAYVYEVGGVIYRKIYEGYFPDYKQLMESGLYDRLISLGYLIPHRLVVDGSSLLSNKHIVLQPDIVRHISYPYEWCFSQLKDAAIRTLAICKIALEHDMILKDATAYNIQFNNCKPVLIDTCSLEKYEEGSAWIAYQQFCKHFLAPLALMEKVDVRLNSLLRIYMDGIPLDLASRLLPTMSWLSFSLVTHIHIHARFQLRYGGGGSNSSSSKKISRSGLLGILDNLEHAINKLKWTPDNTEWGDYYNNTNYTLEATLDKKACVNNYILKVRPSTVWDLGGNDGLYSRVAASAGGGASVVSWDIDPVAVENNYISIKTNGDKRVLPLIQDLANPSSGLGWAGCERDSLQMRAPVDMVMALALIHHLSISNNIPFKCVAEFFCKLSDYLLIEFVPKNDSKVKRLLASREDIFSGYNIVEFENEFSSYYEILEKVKIKNSERHLFLMKRIDIN